MTSGITLNAPSWAMIRLISVTVLLLDWVHRKIIHSLWKSLSGIVFCFLLRVNVLMVCTNTYVMFYTGLHGLSGHGLAVKG